MEGIEIMLIGGYKRKKEQLADPLSASATEKVLLFLLSCMCVVRVDMCGRSVGGGSVEPYPTVRHSVRAAVGKGSVWVRQKDVVVDPVGQYRESE